MSRPKQPAKLALTPVRISPPTKVKLEALSYQTSLTQQEIIRRALDDYFDVLEKEGKFDPRSRRPANARVMGRPRKDRDAPAPAPERRIFRRPGMSASA